MRLRKRWTNGFSGFVCIHSFRPSIGYRYRAIMFIARKHNKKTHIFKKKTIKTLHYLTKNTQSDWLVSDFALRMNRWTYLCRDTCWLVACKQNKSWIHGVAWCISLLANWWEEKKSWRIFLRWPRTKEVVDKCLIIWGKKLTQWRGR